MTRRQRLIAIIVAVVVGLIALGLAVFLVLRPAPAVNAPVEQPETPRAPLAPSGSQTTNATAAPATSTPQPTTPTFSRASAREILEQQLKTSGAQFAERFGTYSNQGDFQNLIDLFPLMTQRMQQQTQRTIDAASAAAAPSNYVGVTTRPVTTTVVSVDETGGRAVIRVSAQRATQTGDGQPVTRYETLTIEFRNQQNVWKVDSALWSTP